MSSSNPANNSFESAVGDYLTRIEQGEAPNPEEYIARYAECANELRQFFDDLAFVDTVTSQAKPAARPEDSEERLDGEDPNTSTASDKLSVCPTLPRVEGFDILEELGNGSQGVVYKAEQLGTKRIVALKVIREGAFASKSERRRFENEVELASRLNHPNIVTLYACGRDSGRDFYAMQFVNGEPLDSYLSTHTLDLAVTLQLFLQICEGVSYAHQHGVIHRDLKPSNVIIESSGTARVLDFGLAKAIAVGSSVVTSAMTQVGDFAGTWYYAAPEQAKKEPNSVDVRTDVYSLGVLLYEMLTDCYPYPVSGQSRETIARHILFTPPMPPSTIRRDVDRDLETIVLRALHKEPQRRYQSASALRSDLRHYLAGEAIDARRDSLWYVLRKTIQRHRWRFAAATVGFVALLAFAVTVFVLYSQTLASQATIELRSRIVRRSQAYLADKLDELKWASNRLTEIAEAHSDLPEIQLLRKDVYEKPLSLFSVIAEGMPERIHEALRSPGQPGYSQTVEWLQEHEPQLAEVERLARTRRFLFGVKRSGDLDLAFYDLPQAMGKAERVCEALTAQALFQYGNAAHELACASLEAARSIAIDLGDGRLLHHTGFSISIRSQIYDVVLMILDDLGSDAVAVRPYINWVLRDPPLARYRLGMMSERQRLAQLCEGAAFSDGPGRPGRIDVDVLDGLADGFYSSIGGLTTEGRASVRLLTPDDALAAVDAFISEIEQWDALPFNELNERANQLISELQTRRAWRVVGPFVPKYRVAFRARRRVLAKRRGMLLAAHLCRYRAEHGRWPEALIDALPENANLGVLDPYTGQAFGYRLRNEHPLLYSVNEDFTDDGGRKGEWGDGHTDVVLFAPGIR